MIKRSFFIAFFICNALLSSISLHAQNKFDPALSSAFNNTTRVSCLIVFKDCHVNTKVIQNSSKSQKAKYLFRQLTRCQTQTQRYVTQYLTAQKIPFEAYFIAPAIAATLSQEEAEAIALLPNVKGITIDPVVQLETPSSSTVTKSFVNPEWNLKMIGADSVWAMGYTGKNVVIGGQDTGVQWDHDILKEKYRGYSTDTVIHDYNWHDAIHAISPLHNDSIIADSLNPCGLDIKVPCDDNRHGTHTVGIMVGSDSTTTYGVAPDAQWIACRNMERGYGSPSSYLACFEWFFAPTNLENLLPDPALAPDVINNSWSCPEIEGCTPLNWALMETAIANLVASGIVVVVSAGNEGRQGCNTVARAPAIFDQSYAVGSVTQSDTLSAFSSLGPVSIDSSYRLKPDIVAPGSNIRSSVLNNNIAPLSGTSMAGPHVAGAVALIIEANPALRGQVKTIVGIINQSAVKLDHQTLCDDFGPIYPNNSYGYGRLDVLRAVEMSRDLANTSLIKEDYLSVYPNPVVDQLHLDLDQASQFDIYNAQGRVVKKGIVYDKVNVSDLPNGFYVIRLASTQMYQARFIKQ